MLATIKGTAKLVITRSQVSVLKSPDKITDPWLTEESTVPTTAEIIAAVGSV